jgi:hypothetical protein
MSHLKHTTVMSHPKTHNCNVSPKTHNCDVSPKNTQLWCLTQNHTTVMSHLKHTTVMSHPKIHNYDVSPKDWTSLARPHHVSEAHFDIDITESTINEGWKFCKGSCNLYSYREALVNRQGDWGALPTIHPIYLLGQEWVELCLISPLVSSWRAQIQTFSTKVYITIPTELYLSLIAVIFCS